MKFSKPLYNIWHITTHHGDMVLYGTRYRPHKGLDLRTKNKHFPTGIGQPLYAPADGRVILKGYSDKAGNMLILDHGEGYRTRYYHLSSYVVSTGTNVKEGDLMGYCGNSGKWTTGGHLHWEVRINGVAVDPLKYLKDEGEVQNILKEINMTLDELKTELRKDFVEKDERMTQDHQDGTPYLVDNEKKMAMKGDRAVEVLSAFMAKRPLRDVEREYETVTDPKEIFEKK